MPVSRGSSRRSLVGGATCRKTPIARSALDKNPMPGHPLEGNPVDEGTTRRGTDTPVHRPEKPTGSTHSSTRGLSPRAQLKRQAEFHSPHRTRPDSPVPNLLGPCNPNQKWRGTLRFLPQLEMRPSSIAPNPVESREAPPNSTVSLSSHRHPEKIPEVTVTSRGNPGFPAATQERSRDSFFNVS